MDQDNSEYTLTRVRAIANRLVVLAQHCCQDNPDDASLERLDELLEKILNLDYGISSQIVEFAYELLLDQGDTDTVAWLSEELELSSELLYGIDFGGRQRVVLFFAIPVAVPFHGQCSAQAVDVEAFEQMVESLVAHNVVSPIADVGLYPVLLTQAQVSCLTYAQIHKLAKSGFSQVCKGVRMLEDTETLLSDQASDLTPEASMSLAAQAQIYYLVGLASVPPDELENIFPDEDGSEGDDSIDDVESSNPGRAPFQGRPSLITGPRSLRDAEGASPETPEDQGDSWEGVFCEHLDEAFGCSLPVLSVMRPDGFFEDVRRGKELLRELELLMFRQEQLPENTAYELGPLKETPDSCSVVVYFNDRSQDPVQDVSPLEAQNHEFVWLVWDHESAEESLDKLESALADMGCFPFSTPNAFIQDAFGSSRLH